MDFGRILSNVNQYYSEKVVTYGATAQGVDWNSLESQNLRFKQLLKVCDKSEGFSINDYGCGYGALLDYMLKKGYQFSYSGFDISSKMLEKARGTHQNLSQIRFVGEEFDLTQADYTIASGIFSVKLQTPNQDWENYLLETLKKFFELSKNGFAFNALTKYSDVERMRSDLYYADPCYLFDYCKRNFSRNVALLHDYELYEFTIIVRK